MLFLDEPTTGLDPQARRSLWDLIAGAQGAGTTVLLTTHYMEEAEQLCDRLAIMDHGKVLELGTVEELVARRFQELSVRFDTLPGLDDARLAVAAGRVAGDARGRQHRAVHRRRRGDHRRAAGGGRPSWAPSPPTWPSGGRPSRTCSST